jgi:hypothetical protein
LNKNWLIIWPSHQTECQSFKLKVSFKVINNLHLDMLNCLSSFSMLNLCTFHLFGLTQMFEFCAISVFFAFCAILISQLIVFILLTLTRTSGEELRTGNSYLELLRSLQNWMPWETIRLQCQRKISTNKHWSVNVFMRMN